MCGLVTWVVVSFSEKCLFLFRGNFHALNPSFKSLEDFLNFWKFSTEATSFMCAPSSLVSSFSVLLVQDTTVTLNCAAIQIAVVKLKSLPGAKKQGFCCFTTHTRDLSRFTRETCLFHRKKLSTLSYYRAESYHFLARSLEKKIFALKHSWAFEKKNNLLKNLRL